MFIRDRTRAAATLPPAMTGVPGPLSLCTLLK
jgi:hypothetical protein